MKANYTQTELDARPCVRCGHGRRYHVTNQNHQHHGQCEHWSNERFCVCSGYVGLTLKLVKELVAMLGGKVKRDTEWQEYVLTFERDKTYHTDSLQDVVGTALTYWGSHPDVDRVEAILKGE